MLNTDNSTLKKVTINSKEIKEINEKISDSLNNNETLSVDEEKNIKTLSGNEKIGAGCSIIFIVLFLISILGSCLGGTSSSSSSSSSHSSHSSRSSNQVTAQEARNWQADYDYYRATGKSHDEASNLAKLGVLMDR